MDRISLTFSVVFFIIVIAIVIIIILFKPCCFDPFGVALPSTLSCPCPCSFGLTFAGFGLSISLQMGLYFGSSLSMLGV
jgi:hypothetical protein